ncbi:nucleoside-diphosphate sugar epimerase/dehydratase [Falsigemmobacter faecalis]|uniref:Polysaccharide biosynthesis protein n=1 Tax=Falsigemmobacter faecalis TaxID=2488730 RepID=A0A3P3D694_9RHOB|nr:nucleoside-diphosphate sugar epimerase/dehydratase [Falsigemmobacter faecalis]RRH69887.1 polysaccharide biosynthesis protein [Falsigemmobacter faecalis]
MLADTALLIFSYAAALALRSGDLMAAALPGAWMAFAVALPVSLFAFIRLGFYRAVIRYVGTRAVLTITAGVLLSCLTMAGAVASLHLAVPLTVPILYALIAFLTVGGIRFAFRALYLRSHSRARIRVIIYGAGQSGRQTAQSLRDGADFNPVAFVDDSPELWGATLNGLRVFCSQDLPALIHDYQAGRILLAVPSATARQRAQILRRLDHLPVHVQTLPDMDQILRGLHRPGEVTEVPVEDLLGRDVVPPDRALMGADITGRVVMVTGGGGSIGSELCRQILHQRPSELIILDHSEYALYAAGQALRRHVQSDGPGVRISECLMSVCDRDSLEKQMRSRGVATVYHTAAYKHVPLVELNPFPAIRNNVFGTLSCVRAASGAGVKKFILISSDKAVRPGSIMGATKRIAELICQAEAAGAQGMRVSMVRFGNVLASSGSVVPLFRRQIAAGGPVTVTHPDVTRYFMTIPEAAQLVIQAGAMARGGEVFLLDMGEPVKIVDLAERMIRLSGLRPVICGSAGSPVLLPQGSIAVQFSSLRQGEKLHEELLLSDNALRTCHPRILSSSEPPVTAETLARLLEALRRCIASEDLVALQQLLRAAPVGYVKARQHNVSARGEGAIQKGAGRVQSTKRAAVIAKGNSVAAGV